MSETEITEAAPVAPETERTRTVKLSDLVRDWTNARVAAEELVGAERALQAALAVLPANTAYTTFDGEVVWLEAGSISGTSVLRHMATKAAYDTYPKVPVAD
jgi:hypothetical protein